MAKMVAVKDLKRGIKRTITQHTYNIYKGKNRYQLIDQAELPATAPVKKSVESVAVNHVVNSSVMPEIAIKERKKPGPKPKNKQL